MVSLGQNVFHFGDTDPVTTYQLSTFLHFSLIHMHALNRSWRGPRGAFILFISSTSMGQKSFCCHHYHVPKGDTDTNAVFFLLCQAQYK